MAISEIKKNSSTDDFVSNQFERAGASGSKVLGLTLVDQGKIKPSSINKILEYSQKSGLRFGESAVKMGLIKQVELDEALAAHFNYPYFSKKSNAVSKELVAAYDPFSQKGEALRTLRSQLILRWFLEGRKTLAIISPQAGSGSSYIAANLAVIWSQMGEKTLLVDADLRNGRQHEIFNVENRIGLSGALVGRGSVETVIKPVAPFRGLSLLPAGAPPPNPSELLERSELQEIMARIYEDYSVIIFDAPPMTGSNGAEFVASQCTDALVVLRKDKTPLSAAAGLIKKIRSLDAEVVGTVMTKF
ncbi:polysaccharide biosynthesis tyrosine autokinase [Halioxenophilus aromaticivorans]|uniref:non-specific protein-tyrosine kinase n=1 Tax=Halioxenophilus aromaticivorans TaxID=1306992 RepID=A0AAV3U168_9ALTE